MLRKVATDLVPCPTCGAGSRESCRSVGRLLRKGARLQTYHAARRRAAAHHEWEPCCPGCKGLAVFNVGDPAPDGWVEIERCDDCGLYETDDDAALAVSREARPWDEVAEEFGPKLTARTATLRAWYAARRDLPAGSCRLFVPEADATAFGLDW